VGKEIHWGRGEVQGCVVRAMMGDEVFREVGYLVFVQPPHSPPSKTRGEQTSEQWLKIPISSMRIW
jgi:hypothetical protein